MMAAVPPPPFAAPTPTRIPLGSSTRFRDLHRERADASRCPIDQNPLASLDLPLVAKTLQGGARSHGHGRGLLEREPRRLVHEKALAANVLCKCGRARTKHLIAGSEFRHVLADRLDVPGHVTAHRIALGL